MKFYLNQKLQYSKPLTQIKYFSIAPLLPAVCGGEMKYFHSNNRPAGCGRHSTSQLSELRRGLSADGAGPQCEGRSHQEVQLQAGHESGLLQ